jgi:transposase
MFVQEAFFRNLWDRKAIARYAGLTGALDESGKKRGERGLAKSGNARARRGILQLAWAFWCTSRTACWPCGIWRDRRTLAVRARS